MHSALGLTALMLFASAGSGVDWVPTWEEALRRASAEEKFIVLDISAAWCAPCRKMTREVYPDPRFVEFSTGHVFMLLDAERDAEGVKLAERFRVLAYPSIIVFDHAGKEIDRLTGGRDVSGLIEELKLIFEHPFDLQRLREAARAQPDNFALQRAAGVRCFLRKEYDDASRFLDQALSLAQGREPEERIRLLTYKARSDLELDRHEAAWSGLEAAEALAPTSSPAGWRQLLKAESLIGLKRHDEAKAILDPLLSSPEDGPRARALLNRLPKHLRSEDKRFTDLLDQAEKKLQEGALEEAVLAATEAGLIYGDSAQAQLLRAQSLIALFHRSSRADHYTQGAEAALRALRLGADDIGIYKGVRELFAAPSQSAVPASPQAAKNFQMAETAFGERQYRTAAELYSELLRAEPTFAPAARRLGDIHYLNEQYEESAKLYGLAAALQPTDAEAHHYAADSYRALGQLDAARRHVHDCLQADPGYPLCWFDLAALPEGQDKGFERHNRIVPLELYLAHPDRYQQSLDQVPPKTAPAWTEYYRVKLEWLHGKFAELHPGQPFRRTVPEELESLAALTAKWGQMRLASPDLRDPELDFLLQLSVEGRLEPFVYYEMFNELYRTDFERWKRENPQILTDYLESFVFEPQVKLLAEGHNNFATRAFNRGVELHQSDPAAAVAFYEKALRMEPWMGPALLNLSQAYLRLEMNEKAEALLARWSDGAPLDPLPLDALAGLRYSQGAYEAAVGLAERALELAEEPTQRERISQNLEIFRAALRR